MAEQNTNVNSEQYERFLIEEGEKIDSYINNYYSRFKIPKPIPPTDKELSFWTIAGLESSIFVLSGLGAAFLSALRTGGLFFLMEVLLVKKYGLPPILGSLAGTVALITSLLAFEGTLIGIGLVKGRESGKIKISTGSLVISMLTVGLASVFSSFTIVEISTNTKLYMDIALALVTGIASSITAYLSFENVGFIRNDVNVKREDKKNLFSKNYKSWEEGAIASYNSTRKNITNKIINSEYSIPSHLPNTPIEENKKLSKPELAYNFVEAYYKQNGSIPTNKTIANALGISVGGSVYNGLEEFISDNYEELLSKGLVKPKKENSPTEKISNFIQSNGKFPDKEDMQQMNIRFEDAISFVFNNQETIRDNGILTEDQIQQAVEEYNKENN